MKNAPSSGVRPSREFQPINLHERRADANRREDRGRRRPVSACGEVRPPHQYLEGLQPAHLEAPLGREQLFRA